MSASIITIPTASTPAREGAAQPGSAEQHDVVRLHAMQHGAAQQQTARAPRTRLRLTRRGRAVFGTLATLAVLAGLAVAAMFGGSRAVATAQTGGADFGYVVVQPGASLWQVAEQIDPAADPRDLVDEIVRLNQLDGSGVQAGQPVAVPLRYAEAPGVVSGEQLGL